MQSTPLRTGPPTDYLLRAAQSGPGREYKDRAFAALGIEPRDVVVDLGCGPGADLPRYAEAAGAGGQVIGVDRDPAAVADARARTAHLPQVSVRVGDIAALDLAAATVDRAHADRVLQHVVDPAGVMAQVRRILRPGGTAVFAEPDWDTLVVDSPDLGAARAYTRFVTERVVRNACIGRQLVRLATQAGLVVAAVDPVTGVFRDVRVADDILGFRRVTDRAVSASYLSPETAAAWLRSLAELPFFASVTVFVVTVRAADA